MMRLSIFGIICVLSYSISACCWCEGEDEEEIITETQVEVIKEEIDTLPPEDLIDSSGYVTDDNAISAAIVEKYGEQWDFCDCVVKNDSVQTAIENASDEDFDRILERMEVIDQHCKEMLTTANRTPEERDAHNRKVRKCLKNVQ
jgi:hypothetical protein